MTMSLGAVNTQVGGPQYFNYTDSLDRTYFSGTPSDPLGGGMHDPYRGAFPLSGLNVTGTGVHAGASTVKIPRYLLLVILLLILLLLQIQMISIYKIGKI